MRPLLGCLAGLLLLGAFPAAAQDANVESEGEVTAGSTENVLPIVIVNTSSRPAGGVAPRISASHSALLNARIEPARVESLPAGGSQEFRFIFDVDPEAEPGSAANAWFEFAADSGKLNATSAELRLLITGAPVVAEAEAENDEDQFAEEAARDDSARPILYLTHIEVPARRATSPPPGQSREESIFAISKRSSTLEPTGAGATFSAEDRAYCDPPLHGMCYRERSAVGFLAFPETIELGSAFEISVESRSQRDASVLCRAYSWSDPEYASTLGVKLLTRPYVEALFQGSETYSFQAPPCDRPDGEPTRLDYSVGNAAQVTIRCHPLADTPDLGSGLPRYPYRCTPDADFGSGVVETEIPWKAGWRFQFILTDIQTATVKLHYSDQENSIEYEPHVPGFEIVNRIEASGNAAAPVVLADWTGRPSQEAQLEAETQDLEVVLIEGSPTIEPSAIGSIASQTPEPGTEVPAGASIELTVFTDGRPVLPDYRGRDSSTATGELAAQGVTARLVEGDTAPESALESRVVSQSPRPGARLAPGSEVVLIVYGAPDLEQAAAAGWGGTIVDRTPPERSPSPPPGPRPCDIPQTQFQQALRRADLAVADGNLDRWFKAILPLAEAGCEGPAIDERFEQAGRMEAEADRQRDRQIADATRASRSRLRPSNSGIYTDLDPGSGLTDFVEIANGLASIARTARAVREGRPVPPPQDIVSVGPNGNLVLTPPSGSATTGNTPGGGGSAGGSSAGGTIKCCPDGWQSSGPLGNTLFGIDEAGGQKITCRRVDANGNILEERPVGERMPNAPCRFPGQ